MTLSHPKIEFAREFPFALRSEIEALFAPFLWLARDMKKLYISLKGSDSEVESDADICTLTRYHIAKIALDPAFWALSTEDKELTVIHELFHIVTDDYTRKVLQAMDAIEDEGVRRHLYTFVSEAEEELVGRLAWDFHELWRASHEIPKPKKASA